MKKLFRCQDQSFNSEVDLIVKKIYLNKFNLNGNFLQSLHAEFLNAHILTCSSIHVKFYLNY